MLLRTFHFHEFRWIIFHGKGNIATCRTPPPLLQKAPSRSRRQLNPIVYPFETMLGFCKLGLDQMK
ncbi:hypothetical protein QQP08_025832 [Theobroma cacao]|nr:hypothetical protein QQP08_025832 [Theobroma cacao]